MNSRGHRRALAAVWLASAMFLLFFVNRGWIRGNEGILGQPQSACAGTAFLFKSAALLLIAGALLFFASREQEDEAARTDGDDSSRPRHLGFSAFTQRIAPLARASSHPNRDEVSNHPVDPSAFRPLGTGLHVGASHGHRHH